MKSYLLIFLCLFSTLLCFGQFPNPNTFPSRPTFPLGPILVVNQTITIRSSIKNYSVNKVGCNANYIYTKLSASQLASSTCSGLTIASFSTKNATSLGSNKYSIKPGKTGEFTYTLKDNCYNTLTYVHKVTVVNPKPQLEFCPNDKIVKVACATNQTASAYNLNYARVTYEEPRFKNADRVERTGPSSGSKIYIGNPQTVTYTAYNCNEKTVCQFKLSVIREGNGESCNDGNPCTVNDKFDADCNCAGTFKDSDGDGVCDANDVCHGFNDNLIGSSCDDGNSCTSNDKYDSDCNCVGTKVSAPTITCPSNITKTLACDETSVNVTYSEPNYTGCGASIARVSGIASGHPFSEGTHTVTYEVTDDENRKARCSFNIIVNKEQCPTPTISCQGTINKTLPRGSSQMVVTYNTPTGSGCKVSISHVSGPESGAPLQEGNHKAVWKVTDDCNQVKTCTIDINIAKAATCAPPTISCPKSVKYILGCNQTSRKVTYNTNLIVTGCGVTVKKLSGPDSGDYLGVGTHVVRYQVKDDVGRFTECAFSIIIERGNCNYLSINCEETISKKIAYNKESIKVFYNEPKVDGCLNRLDRVSGPLNGTYLKVGTYKVVWKATDKCGRAATCTQDIIVTKARPSPIPCHHSFTTYIGCGENDKAVNYTIPGVTFDRTSGSNAKIIRGPHSGDRLSAGTYTVDYEITQNGRKQTCSFNISVLKGNSNPTFLTPKGLAFSEFGTRDGGYYVEVTNRQHLTPGTSFSLLHAKKVGNKFVNPNTNRGDVDELKFEYNGEGLGSGSKLGILFMNNSTMLLQDGEPADDWCDNSFTGGNPNNPNISDCDDISGDLILTQGSIIRNPRFIKIDGRIIDVIGKGNYEGCLETSSPDFCNGCYSRDVDSKWGDIFPDWISTDCDRLNSGCRCPDILDCLDYRNPCSNPIFPGGTLTCATITCAPGYTCQGGRCVSTGSLPCVIDPACDPGRPVLGFKSRSPNIERENLPSEPEAKVFPNPIELSETQVHFNMPTDGEVKIQIHDVYGKLIEIPMLPTTYSAGIHQFQWNVPRNFQPGVYYMSIDVAGKTFVEKILYLE